MILTIYYVDGQRVMIEDVVYYHDCFLMQYILYKVKGQDDKKIYYDMGTIEDIILI